MLLLLVLSAALLGSAVGSAVSSPAATTLGRRLVDVCLEGSEQLDPRELKAELEQVQQRLIDVQQQQLTALQQQQQTSVQLTAFQRTLTAVQQQLAVPTVSEDCPGNWVRHGSACYLLPQLYASWLEANTACALLDRRARLASVHDANKDHVNGLVSASIGRAVWIGLIRLQGGDSWGWTDGTPLDYVGWNPGEPNNLDFEDVCGAAVPSLGGAWWEEDCTNRAPFLCQISLG